MANPLDKPEITKFVFEFVSSNFLNKTYASSIKNVAGIIGVYCILMIQAIGEKIDRYNAFLFLEYKKISKLVKNNHIDPSSLTVNRVGKIFNNCAAKKGKIKECVV
ncbi:hypothetical protein HYX18_03030 [Candidatus Woesearchaeota archaeon]|nr:hypothetical protein [Candidatus Woesearchaeota archaeon]